MNIPEGYALVPVELTQEMIQAGIDTECVDTGDADFDELQDYRSVYKSFLESAPKSPVYNETKERELFDAWHEEYLSCGWSVSKIVTWESWKACAKSRVRSA